MRKIQNLRQTFAQQSYFRQLYVYTRRTDFFFNEIEQLKLSVLNTKQRSMQIERILAAYGLHAADCPAVPFGTGLINRTWKVTCKRTAEDFILQRLNTAVFKDPHAIGRNIRDIAGYLHLHYQAIGSLRH